MYEQVKKLMYTVQVDRPAPSFGNMLLEQFGAANGELAAAMQYSIQWLNCDDPARKDMLRDILPVLHLKPMKTARKAAAGDADSRSPWNEGGAWKYVETPAFQDFKREKRGTRTTDWLAALAEAIGEARQVDQSLKTPARGAETQDPKHPKGKRGD